MVFPVLFSTFISDLSLTAPEKIPQSAGNGCRKSHVILSIFMQPGLGLEIDQVVRARALAGTLRCVLTQLNFHFASLHSGV